MIKSLLVLGCLATAPAAEAARYVCETCNTNEKTTLSFMQDQGIKDKNALAVVLGNIKQESNFHPNICEGGARVSYLNCRSGGYGLIQWTSIRRYKGLGAFASKYGGDPSTLGTQLRYLANEKQWQDILPSMKTSGQSIDWYMNKSYRWLGWGIHGYRTRYAKQYANKLTLG